jgi:hypothetical protein
MQYKPYTDLMAVPDLSIFRFISEGVPAHITKEIRFAELPDSGMYSIHMGDIKQNGDFDPFAISNNGDRNRVLATVFRAIEMYTEKYPARSILIGSLTKQRARLFRIAIGANMKILSRVFTILEVHEGRFSPFKPNTDSTIFHLRRKKLPGNKICATPASLPVNEDRKVQGDLLRQKDDIFELCARGLPEEKDPASESQVNEINDQVQTNKEK